MMMKTLFFNKKMAETIEKNNPNVIKAEYKAKALTVFLKDGTEIEFTLNNENIKVIRKHPVKVKPLFDVFTDSVAQEIRSRKANIIDNRKDLILPPSLLLKLNGVHRVIINSKHTTSKVTYTFTVQEDDTTQKIIQKIKYFKNKESIVTLYKRKHDYDVIQYKTDVRKGLLKEQLTEVRELPLNDIYDLISVLEVI